MENVMSVEEKNKIVNMYSARLCRNIGQLGRYYGEIVDNMTYEDAKMLLDLGVKYGFVTSGDDFATAFKVVLAYASQYLKIFNYFTYRKNASEFDSYYDYLCAQIDYYSNLITELSDEDSISTIIADSISGCISDDYPEFVNMPLLDNINNYLIKNIHSLLMARIECQCDVLSRKRAGIGVVKNYGLKKYYGFKSKDGHYISDNHI